MTPNQLAELPASTLTHLECSICGEHHDDRVPQTVCTACGRVLLARYDLERARRTFSGAILYPTGGGTGLVGMWKAFEELEAMGLIGAARPRMIAVQSTGCAPVVRAFEAGAERGEPWADAETLAPGIRVPSPYADDLIQQVLRASGGDAVAVEEDEIVAAMRETAAAEGIDACPEGGAVVAGARRLIEAGRLDPKGSIVLFNTGTGLKHPELRVPL